MIIANSIPEPSMSNIKTWVLLQYIFYPRYVKKDFRAVCSVQFFGKTITKNIRHKRDSSTIRQAKTGGLQFCSPPSSVYCGKAQMNITTNSIAIDGISIRNFDPYVCTVTSKLDESDDSQYRRPNSAPYCYPESYYFHSSIIPQQKGALIFRAKGL